jgi:hypothetical protein
MRIFTRKVAIRFGITGDDEERLESQVRTMLVLDQTLHRGREAAIRDADKLSALESELSAQRSLLEGTAAPVQKAAPNIDSFGATAAEQLLTHGRGTCTLEDKMGIVRAATMGIGRSLGREGDSDRRLAEEGEPGTGRGFSAETNAGEP